MIKKIAFWLFLVSIVLQASDDTDLCINQGIVKFNQKVVPNSILNDSSGCIPIKSIFDCFDSCSAKFSSIWAIDLTNTFMMLDELNEFLTSVLPKLPKLQVLVLHTVHLNEGVWQEHLFPLLKEGTFEILDVYNSLYANKDIQPILKIGKRTYNEEWLPLSAKIVFASSNWYSRLKASGKWIKACEEKKLLVPDWDETHKKYYADYDKKIKKAVAFAIPAGDSDDEDDVDSFASSEDD